MRPSSRASCSRWSRSAQSATRSAPAAARTRHRGAVSGAAMAASTPLRGRVRCGLCGQRMEGSHQRDSNWYRCRFVWNRGKVAADTAGHPRSLQIKEETILREVIDFMGRRIFGPDRLRLLRLDLARSIGDSWREHDTEVKRLEREQEHIKRALHRQTLRLEEHDDPNHPVVAAAKQRIEELTSRQAATEHAIQDIEARRPEGIRPEEVEAMLDAVPDLRDELQQSCPGGTSRLARSLRCDGYLRQGREAAPPRRDRAGRTRLRKRKTPTAQRESVGGFVHSGADSSLRATRGSRNGTGWRPSQGHESHSCHPPAAHGVWVPARRFCFSREATTPSRHRRGGGRECRVPVKAARLRLGGLRPVADSNKEAVSVDACFPGCAFPAESQVARVRSAARYVSPSDDLIVQQYRLAA
jgi:recombinase-like zinc beta ribbon protein